MRQAADEWARAGGDGPSEVGKIRQGRDDDTGGELGEEGADAQAVRR